MSNSGGFKKLTPKNEQKAATPLDVGNYHSTRIGGTDMFEGDATRISNSPKKEDTKKKSY